MENLFGMSIAIKLRETFCNSWGATDDGALSLPGVGKRRFYGPKGATTCLETGCLRIESLQTFGLWVILFIH